MQRESLQYGAQAGAFVFIMCQTQPQRGDTELTAQLHSVAAHKIHRAFLPCAANRAWWQPIEDARRCVKADMYLHSRL